MNFTKSTNREFGKYRTVVDLQCVTLVLNVDPVLAGSNPEIYKFEDFGILEFAIPEICQFAKSGIREIPNDS